MASRISEYMRETARVCEREFGFLVQEFGYRLDKPRFESGGFALRYSGSSLGVEVDWYPRDTLMVWLVRLVDGEFPQRPIWILPDAVLNHFDLEDLEVISGYHRQVGEMQLYMPTAENVRLLADSLRACGADLLRGDLTRLAQLERRIMDRARARAIENLGEEGAARRGW
jgi:hypothetical protein